MSGFEIAGVVLGALPLVIAALGEYKAGKGLYAVWKFEGLLDDLKHQLSLQRTTFYLDILQLLREAKVSSELLDDVDPSETRCISVLGDAKTKDEVKRYLGQLYPLFLETLACYEKCLKEIASKLGNLVRPKTAAKDDLDAILRAHSDRGDGLSLAKVRLKFAMDRKSLDALVQDLRTERYSLGKLLKRVKTQRDWEARQPSAYSTKMAKLFAQVQLGAASLYRAACQCWTCKCRHRHTIMVRLENRIVASPHGACPPHINFRVCFFTGETPIQETEVRARATNIKVGQTGNWEEHIEPIHYSLRVERGTVDLVGRTRDGRLACETEETTAVPVTNMCMETSEARRRGHTLALDLTADKLSLREDISKSKLQQSFKSTTTLRDFLTAASQNPDARMTPKQQSLLALDVAAAVLQLQRTPWSGLPWNNQKIKFLVEGNGAVASWAPIVEQIIVPAILSSAQPRAQTPKATVLELAILMLEILQHKSLETWAAETQQGGTATFGERLEAADRWLELSDDKLLPHHLNAIESCLQQCVGRNSSWNIEFQKLFCESVIQPLQQLVMPLPSRAVY